MADLSTAIKAYEKGDYETAFNAFHELAQLGQPGSQFNVAVMYLNGQGTKPLKAYAYAWAQLALANGEADAQKIIDAVKPELTPGSLRIAEGIQQQYGREALEKNLMPRILDPARYAMAEGCRLKKAFTPAYPVEAERRGIQGNAFTEFTVMPDGTGRNPRIIYAVPSGLFDDAIRKSVLRSEFLTPIVDGKAVPCTMNIGRGQYEGLDVLVKKTKQKAEAGDTSSQMVYGMLLTGLPQLKKPRSEALPWFLKAAQSGHPTAQYTVGYSMLKGWGCECEENKGLEWLQRAAAADQADAQVTLASYSLRGEPDEVEIGKAKRWLERATERGSRDAKLYLAALLASTPSEAVRDPERARKLLDEVFRAVDDDPLAFEIRAAAAAGQKDFARAVKDQSRAVEMAKRLGWDLAPQLERLAAYQANTPWRGPLLPL
jgi:hypothetical protein